MWFIKLVSAHRYNRWQMDTTSSARAGTFGIVHYVIAALVIGVQTNTYHL